MASKIPTRLLAGGKFEIRQIVHGLWQTAGGHGKINPTEALKYMVRLVEAGFTSFDGADHYGPAELLMGELRKWYASKNGADKLGDLQLFTKWVPHSEPMPRALVEQAIDRSLQRMATDSLDLMQFHWWDYEDMEYITALKHMQALQKEGKIKYLALTNFDTERLRIMYKNGIQVVSNQVSYSVIDRRPEKEMVKFCLEHDIKLLTYGTLLGGFLSEKWIGVAEPTTKAQLNTSSLGKYKRFIDHWGSWTLFQELLSTMKKIADKHNVGISNVATRFVLDKPAVGAVIVGIRPGLSDHIESNTRTFSFELAAEDTAAIEAVVSKGKQLPGDCGDEYRYRW
eukprot:TRINITY_DN3013_c0_g1_i2.p1 TRINITY_DN3013_c0_g1~~TRINITY_DN3013_c0_g1_i2.p1  ORF type:complete len:340 (+),score=75.59 TRINITY_DN3013_c0_g1_i2:21-1040(+)